MHVHDILYPFEYPAEWVFDGRAWSEAYVLRGLLAGNAHLEITWWNNYMGVFHMDEVRAAIPRWAENAGGSIYIQTR